MPTLCCHCPNLDGENLGRRKFKTTNCPILDGDCSEFACVGDCTLEVLTHMPAFAKKLWTRVSVWTNVLIGICEFRSSE